MSLLDKIFNFLGIATYNVTPPVVANAQATTLQCDKNGRLLVTIAAITAGAPVLAMPVTTVTRQITSPTATNGFQVSAPFNTSGGTVFFQYMPATPIRGMRVTIPDSGGFAATTACGVEDLNGFKIQDPLNPTSLVTTYTFNQSGFAATWEFITGDPTNGSFWMCVRSLQ